MPERWPARLDLPVFLTLCHLSVLIQYWILFNPPDSGPISTTTAPWLGEACVCTLPYGTLPLCPGPLRPPSTRVKGIATDRHGEQESRRPWCPGLTASGPKPNRQSSGSQALVDKCFMFFQQQQLLDIFSDFVSRRRDANFLCVSEESPVDGKPQGDGGWLAKTRTND